MKNKKIVFALSALAAGCVCGGQNLLTNSNLSALEADGTPVGWSSYDKSVWRVVKGEGENGSNAFVYESVDGKSHASPGQTLTLEPGKKYVYSVKVRHENLALSDKKRANGVQVGLIGLDADGKRTCGYYHHGMQGTWNEWYELREYIMEVPLWTKSARYSVSLWNGITGKAWFSDMRVEEYVPPLVEKLVTSAYRDKAWTGKVRFAASLNLPKESVPSFKGAFIYRDAKGQETRVAPDSMDAETAFLALDIQSLAKGEQTLRFELAGADGKVAASAARAFTRLAARPSAYKLWFDEHGRWIVNGRPFFPLGVAVNNLSKGDHTEKIQPVIDAGFNLLMTGGQPPDPIWDYCLTNGLKLARNIGNLYVGERWTVKRGWKTYADQFNYLTNRIAEAKDKPAMLFWSLNDETRPRLIPKMEKQQKLFATFDPSHPTSSTYDHPEFIRGYLDTFDLCNIDVYPVGNAPLSGVSDELISLRRGATGVKPFGVTLQAMDWSWFRMGKVMPTPHFPTVGELRNMVWQAIAGGTTSIKYYGFNHFLDDCAKKDYERNYAVLKKVNSEVRRYLPVILSIEEPVKVAVPEKSKLLVRSWRLGGESFVLIVNALGEGARAELKLSETFDRAFLEWGDGVEFVGGDTLSVTMEALGCALVHLTDNSTHLVYAGDSLLDGRAAAKTPARGSWGEELRARLKAGVKAVNTAHSGMSTRTFRANDYWYETLAHTRPGDRVVISFGHNDSHKHTTDRSVTAEGYRQNLMRFADEVRAKGAVPVFVTPVATCTFRKDGTYNDLRGLEAYVAAMKVAAQEKGVEVVDLYARTCADVKSLGFEKAKAHYMYVVDGKDVTHTTKAGAKRYATFAEEEIRSSAPSLANLLKVAR